jgi:hypothetical protein
MTDKKINDGGPAFPANLSIVNNDSSGQWTEVKTVPGMTLRDWFAGTIPLTPEEQNRCNTDASGYAFEAHL